MTSWRLIRDDGATAAGGLAADETLARRVGAGASPPTLRLYTYRPHVALIGRFQDAANELHLDACRANDVQVNRRPTGGGAILMGPDQLGVALVRRARDRARDRDRTMRAREAMARFSAGLVGGLDSLGIRASFRGKNDLEVDGRKIAGLGIHREPSGGLLFHASLLVDLDVALMTRVLRIPMERAGDVERLARRTATVRGLLGRGVSLDDVRARVARGFADAFDVSLEPGALDRPELLDVEALERRKYLTGDWVFQRTEVPDAAGAARLDTPGGTLDVRVALAGRMIKSVAVTGDFFADDAALADLEGRLRWHPCRADAVGETVGSWARTQGSGTLAPADLAEAIVAAIRDADAGGARGDAPYACFAPSHRHRTREVALG